MLRLISRLHPRARASSFVARAASAASFAFVAAFTPSARADVTSWLSVGGGYGIEQNTVANTPDRAVAYSMTLGVGTSPTSNLVVGGILRSTTYFSLGTDLGIAARFATGGFARGDWGLALDAGVAARWWNAGDDGRYPIQAFLTAGAPWGVQLAAGVDVWNLSGAPYARGYVGLLEIDLLRLTVMRQGQSDAYWHNPAPAGAHPNAPPAGPRLEDLP